MPLGVPDTLYLLVAGLFGADTETVYLSPAPLYHAAPLRFCLQVQRAGGTVVVMEHFDAEESLRLIQEHRVTFGQFVPTMFVRMLKLPQEVRGRYDVSSVQVAVHAAAPCPVTGQAPDDRLVGPGAARVLRRHRGQRVLLHQLRGLAGAPGHRRQADRRRAAHRRRRTARRSRRASRAPCTSSREARFAYHNDPDKTAESYLRDGWSTLGDVGYVDDDGFLYLTDRKAYMIITGGVNVYPQEAENVLTMHPLVDDVAVFGVPNDDFGEEVKAVVQPAEMPADEPAAQALAAELIAFCRSQLADVKCPRSIDFRDALPRHPTGKLYKRLLKDEYWDAAGRKI